MRRCRATTRQRRFIQVNVSVKRAHATLVFLLSIFFSLDSSAAAGQKHVEYVQVVNRAPTSVALSYSAATINAGQSVQFTAAISPTQPSTPKGSVVFSAMGATAGSAVASPPIQLDASGSAVWIGTFPIADSYILVATYSGDLNYLASKSETDLLTVTGLPDFQIASPGQLTIHQGGTSSASISIASLNGFTGAITLKCGNVPIEMQCSLSPTTVIFTPQMVLSGPSSPRVAYAYTTITIRTYPKIYAAAGFVVFFFGLFGLVRKRKARVCALTACALMICCYLAGCGGNAQFKYSKGTQLGAYSIEISGQSNAISHTQLVAVLVVK